MRRVKLTRGLNYGSNVSLQWEMENDLSSSYPTEGVCKLLVTFLIELKKKKKDTITHIETIRNIYLAQFEWPLTGICLHPKVRF